MTDFNSGNFDPGKLNRLQYNHDKKGKGGEEAAKSEQEQAPQAPDRFNPVNADEILDFMAKNSAINLAGVEQANVGKRVAQFASFLSEDRHAELMDQFRAVVDEEVSALGLELSEAARNELAELSLANYAIGTPVVNQA